MLRQPVAGRLVKVDCFITMLVCNVFYACFQFSFRVIFLYPHQDQIAVKLKAYLRLNNSL